MELTPERAKLLEDFKTILSTPDAQFILVGFHAHEGGTQAICHSHVTDAPTFAQMLVETQESAPNDKERFRVFNMISSFAAVFMTASIMVNKSPANTTVTDAIGHLDKLFGKRRNDSTNAAD